MRMRFSTTGFVLAVAALLFAAQGAVQAAFIVNVTQSGGNVVANGSGTINTTAFTADGSGGNPHAYVSPINGEISVGPATGTSASLFDGYTGPTSFGSGFTTTASSGSGNVVQMDAIEGFLYVPSGYVSGSALSDTSTWNGQTLSSLGITPGTYTWNWGSAATADSFTLNVTVPEPTSLALLAMSSVGLLALRRRRSARSGAAS